MISIPIRLQSGTCLGAIFIESLDAFDNLAKLRSEIVEQHPDTIAGDWFFHTGAFPISKAQETLTQLTLAWLLNEITPGSGTAGGGHLSIILAQDCSKAACAATR